MYDPGCLLVRARMDATSRNMLSSLRPLLSALRFLGISLIFVAPVALWSQVSASSQISGVVTDQTGGRIPAAEVVFTSGSFITRQITNAQGEFVFSQIFAESGELKISAPGFQLRSL